MTPPNILQHFQSFPSFMLQHLALFYHSFSLNCSHSSMSLFQPQLWLSLARLSQTCSTQILIDFYLGICFRIWYDFKMKNKSRKGKNHSWVDSTRPGSAPACIKYFLIEKKYLESVDIQITNNVKSSIMNC